MRIFAVIVGAVLMGLSACGGGAGRTETAPSDAPASAPEVPATSAPEVPTDSSPDVPADSAPGEPADSAPDTAPVAETPPAETMKRVVKAGATCGGFPGVACDTSLYCSMESGHCNIADDQGVCKAVPEVCTQQYDPVCGCDGKTYGNSCMAAMARANVDRPGEC